MGGFLPSRRRFLGGAGAVVGLPFLDSALPRAAWGQPAPQLLRVMPVFFPNGFDRRGYGTGANWETSAILAPMAPHKSRTLILDGLCNFPAAGLHEKAIRGLLTCQAAGGGDTNTGGGISMDQVIAQKLAGQTRTPSLQLGLDSTTDRTISWTASTQPLPSNGNLADIFNKIFAGFDPNVSQGEIDRRRRYETSVLDYVMGEVQTLQPKLGRADKSRMDQYLTQIRSLEMQVNAMTPVASGGMCSKPAAAPTGSATPDKLKALMDLSVMAFECDATRVLTLQVQTYGTSHTWIGVPGNHHDLSHWGADTAKRDAIQKINVWEVQQYAYLIGRLAALDGGKFFDNSLVFFTSEISEGDSHATQNTPFIVNGTLGGTFPNGGRYVKVKSDLGHQNRFNRNYLDGSGWSYMPSACFFLDIINKFGGGLAKFGEDGDRSLLATGQLG